MGLRHISIVVSALCGLPTLAGAAQFMPLPFPTGMDNSSAFDISSDGHVIVGQSHNSNTFGPVRWIDGVVSELPGGISAGDAEGVSAHGEVVVGGSNGMFRWSSSTGWQLLPNLGKVGYGAARGVSADGEVVVGSSAAAGVSGLQAVLWSSATGLVSLGRLDGAANEAYAVSDDGRIVVGGSTDGGPSFIWTAATGIQPLSNIPASFTSRAIAMNSTGRIIVGGNNLATSYRWKDGVVTLLGFGEAKAVSEDGSIVFGDATGRDGWIWSEGAGVESLHDYFTDLGIYPVGWTGMAVYDMASDGQTIIGAGYLASGKRQAFYAVIPEPSSLAIMSLSTVGLFKRTRRVRRTRLASFAAF